MSKLGDAFRKAGNKIKDFHDDFGVNEKKSGIKGYNAVADMARGFSAAGAAVGGPLSSVAVPALAAADILSAKGKAENEIERNAANRPQANLGLLKAMDKIKAKKAAARIRNAGVTE